MVTDDFFDVLGHLFVYVFDVRLKSEPEDHGAMMQMDVKDNVSESSGDSRRIRTGASERRTTRPLAEAEKSAE
jgi:hypothetical protein